MRGAKPAYMSGSCTHTPRERAEERAAGGQMSLRLSPEQRPAVAAARLLERDGQPTVPATLKGRRSTSPMLSRPSTRLWCSPGTRATGLPVAATAARMHRQSEENDLW